MLTAEQIADRQANQRSEADGRLDPADDTGHRAPDARTELTLETTGEGDDPAPRGADDGTDRQQPERTKPIHMSPQDVARQQIAKRFRRDEDGEVPYNGNPNDPEMMYGKHGRPVEQQIDPDLEPEPAPAPVQPEKKFTIKVRGKDVQLTEAELLERASKVEAADSYLADSRDLLEQAKAIRNGNGERAPADSRRPENRDNTQNDQTDRSLSADPQHPEDELEGAIEEVRYGTDPKEAAKKLRTVLSKEADSAADKRQLQRLIGNDTTKSAKARDTFIAANPDIANDEDACVLMEKYCYDIQRAELKEMGVDESKLPKDNRELAQWHQFQRVHGHAVSSQDQMLEKARERYVKFKGGSPTAPQPAPRKDAPRVQVSVDRDTRRAALPNQPTRSMAPPAQILNRQQPNAAPAPRSRSDVIMGMRKGRGQV